MHSGPENDQDSFTQSALTVEGKVSDFDITYAGAWFVRNQHSIADYSDYSYLYDKYYGSGALWTNNARRTPSMPQEFVIEDNHYTKWSNELRVSTPQQYPVKATVGVFAQRQVHEIWEDYVMPGSTAIPYTFNTQGLASACSLPALNNNTIWLTDEERVDRDSAAFAQVTWDIAGGMVADRRYPRIQVRQLPAGLLRLRADYTGPGPHSGQATCGPPGLAIAGPPTELRAVSLRAVHRFESHGCVGQRPYRARASSATSSIPITWCTRPTRPDFARAASTACTTRRSARSIRLPIGPAQELRGRLEDAVVRRASAVEWRAVLGRLERLPVLLPGSQQRDRGAERGLCAQPRHRDQLRVAGGGRLGASGSATFLDAKLTQNFCGTNS